MPQDRLVLPHAKPEAGPWAVGLYSPERRSPEPTCAGRVPSTRRAWPAEAQEPRGAAGRAGGSARRSRHVVITCGQVRGAAGSGLRGGRVSAAERVLAPVHTFLGPPHAIWKCAAP